MAKAKTKTKPWFYNLEKLCGVGRCRMNMTMTTKTIKDVDIVKGKKKYENLSDFMHV
jgi:hypothetical protein